MFKDLSGCDHSVSIGINKVNTTDLTCFAQASPAFVCVISSLSKIDICD